MSLRLYIIFEPSGNLALDDMARRINARVPGVADVKDNFINIEGKFPGILYPPSYLDEGAIFSYWTFYFWAYWKDVVDGTDFRQFVMNLCEAMGTEEWWYIEETSMDLYGDMDEEEFLKVLIDSNGIEDFELPHFFPHSEHHIFNDSSSKVKSLMAE